MKTKRPCPNCHNHQRLRHYRVLSSDVVEVDHDEELYKVDDDEFERTWFKWVCRSCGRTDNSNHAKKVLEDYKIQRYVF